MRRQTSAAAAVLSYLSTRRKPFNALCPLLFPLSDQVAACTLVAVAMLSACGHKDDAQAGGPAAPAAKMPPPQVGVITTHFQQVALETELPARVEADPRGRSARPRQRRRAQAPVHRGQHGQAGPVAVPDRSGALPGPAQNAAQAALGRAQANLASAAATVERYKPLVEAQADQQAGIHERGRRRQAGRGRRQFGPGPGCASPRSTSTTANVYAPISGRIGRALVTEGALVSATEATQLALIQQTDHGLPEHHPVGRRTAAPAQERRRQGHRLAASR